MEKELIKGLSVCHPTDADKSYLLHVVQYAEKMGFNHIQICGPIHNGVKGNIDGMTAYRKYSQFDCTKDAAYIALCMDAVNAACERASRAGIKMYQWHHELDLPDGFQQAYPEILNSFGDVEVTHPKVKDFLENKIKDFFHAYPLMDGIVLTLHETKVPLLKLKDQKLGKVERVKYVTQILFETCQSLGKELIVRPFASIEEDYVLMTKAYEQISRQMPVMDKWTQFDWSLTLPNNAFFHKIQNNPLMVEADIFGEYFGRGRLPLLLKEHIAEKVAYCKAFQPMGYAARIDRAGEHPFGDVNEVNLHIFKACMDGTSVDAAVEQFYRERYGDAGNAVMELMLPTEQIQKKTFYIGGYYFSQGSLFPELNHSKNHFYFEMMRENPVIASNEWFIPRGWKNPTVEEMVSEKDSAVAMAERAYEKLLSLQDRLQPEDYQALLVKFTNLKLVTQIWRELLLTFAAYTRYFETEQPEHEKALHSHTEQLLKLSEEGKRLLANQFYCLQKNTRVDESYDRVAIFVKQLQEAFAAEKAQIAQCREDSPLDFVLCGGAMEGHALQKEVNFSDTLLVDGHLCRIPGNKKGMLWSKINAHGWFSYCLQVRPNRENTVKLWLSGADGELDVRVTVGEKQDRLQDHAEGMSCYTLTYPEQQGDSSVRIRIDKISGHTPCVHSIIVI